MLQHTVNTFFQARVERYSSVMKSVVHWLHGTKDFDCSGGPQQQGMEARAMECSMGTGDGWLCC